MFLNAMHPDLMPVQGTDLGAALRVSLDALEQGGRESRVLLLITDGEDHEGVYDAELERVDALGVEIHVVGIGSTEGVPIPLYDEAGARQGFLRDEDGAVVTTRFDEGTLRRLVGSRGTIVRAGAGGTGLEELIDRIASGVGETVDERQITQFEEQYQIFLGLALLLLMGEWFVSDRRRATEGWKGRFE
jgi:Ca-activated chloride channel family protein